MMSEAEETGQGPRYSYRASLMGGGWEFALTATGLDWSTGRHSGHVPFAMMRRVRMAFRPMSMQQHRFITDIWAEGTPKIPVVSTSWKSLVEYQRQDKEYSGFIRELHRRLAASGAPVLCEQGNHPLLFWPAVAVFAGMLLALAYLIVRALEEGAPGGALFIAAFLLLLLWRGGNFFRRNRPGLYSVEAPPRDLLPGE